MRATIEKILEQIRASYWFVPAVLALAAAALAGMTVALDARLDPSWTRRLFGIAAGNADGARAVTAAIAGSMLGVAGTVFSVTMAAVVYASGQYGPRLLTNFMSDRGNQITLGTFIATFVFNIIVLRTIRAADDSGAGQFVPHIALLTGMALALASIAVLIFFIHHVPTRIHISNVIDGIGRALLSGIPARFPVGLGTAAGDMARPGEVRWQVPACFEDGAADRSACADYGEVVATSNGYVQFIDARTLMEAAGPRQVIVRLNVRPGTFVFRGMVLFDVWPAERLDAPTREALVAAVATGARRTPADDLVFLIDELAEIAGRALSPGVNDPFTAVGCMNWMAAALFDMAGRPTPDRLRCDEGGTLRVIAPALSFADYLARSFGAIRDYVARDKIAATRFLQALAALAPASGEAAVRRAIHEEGLKLAALSRTALAGASLEEVEGALTTLEAALWHPRGRVPGLANAI